MLRFAVLLLILASGHVYANERRAPAFLSGAPSSEQQYQLALEDETSGAWRQMLHNLQQAAERGFIPAQEHLAIVLLAGDTLFDGRGSIQACEALHWASRAASQGSETGELLRHLLLRNRNRNGAVRCRPVP
jgi:TPR repeat protein